MKDINEKNDVINKQHHSKKNNLFLFYVTNIANSQYIITNSCTWSEI